MRTKVLIEDFSSSIKGLSRLLLVIIIVVPSIIVTVIRIGILYNTNNLPSSLEVKNNSFNAFVHTVDYFGESTFLNTTFFKNIEDVSEGNKQKIKATLENGNVLFLSFKDNEFKESFLNQINNKERFR